MAEDATDILMMVVPRGGKALATGRIVDVTSGDVDLLTGKDAPSPFTSTTTCYLTGFGMAAGAALHLAKNDKAAGKAGDEKAKEGGAGRKVPPGSPRDGRAPAAEGRGGREQEEGRAGGKAAEAKGQASPGEPQPVEFRRRMDQFSPVLFQLLVDQTRDGNPKELASVSIVKRKATGGATSGTATSGDAFLRLDFTEVLLVSLDWEDDEDGVKETGTFVYRDLLVQYLPQNPDGSLGSSVHGTYTASVGGGAKGSP